MSVVLHTQEEGVWRTIHVPRALRLGRVEIPLLPLAVPIVRLYPKPLRGMPVTVTALIMAGLNRAENNFCSPEVIDYLCSGPETSTRPGFLVVPRNATDLVILQVFKSTKRIRPPDETPSLKEIQASADWSVIMTRR